MPTPSRALTHTYSLELETQRVWDYAGDNYVHRLLQNTTDGKLVELDHAHTGPAKEKLESLEQKYNALLVSQLDEQRAFFEAQLADAGGKATEVEKIKESMQKMEQRMRALERENTKWKAQVQRLEAENSFLKEINGSLTTNQDAWKAKLKEKEESCSAQVAELEDQVKDLMFFIEAGKKLEQMTTDGSASQSELEDGEVLMVPSPHKKKASKGKRRGKR
eukprot:CAMPEP_0177633234 /NCGR_PEP_ID=MMETSP0447-20121125/2728_1 /TAXON_ID=0 /ORGANISM="Stygamoeba regulata, Strain BSH-02190019" /LENGTH=219 /DNA_ID=CAMNT_0019134879 /DNA_START=1 /DNA_END=660 /DNA_ORIENTATION=+